MKLSLQSVALCTVVGLALPHPALAQPAAGQPEEDPAESASLAEAKALYQRGRTNFETANYPEAIELWTQAYGLVDDSPQNATIKAALIYNIATAQEKAYDIDTDLAHLRQAEVLLQTYANSVPALYGEGPESDAELEKVQGRIAQLRSRIEEAEAALPAPDEPVEPDETENPPPPEAPQPDPKAKPLIIAGAVTAGLGVAGLGLMAGGLAMGSAANDVPEDQALEDRRSQFDRGRTGNTLAYVGGIAGGVLLVSGAVLLGIGLKKRNTGKLSAAPWGGRGTAGLSLAGRF